ncbi:MAG TPA: RHS repeat-associated core domain-containing protein [Bryobacteraceae bacterium]|nr:RHS repeat-associated core domain-containing protein [Bryobacteraceae bacterium]
MRRLQSFVDPNADSAYYPWGEEYESRPEEQEKFATYFRDGATMIDYAQNRYYSSTLGRFLTADPYRNSAGPSGELESVCVCQR